MKRLSFILLLTLLGLAVHGQDLRTEQLIAGQYEYTHSWDYAAPDGNGTMHCDEVGRLFFYPDGTFADTAMQDHVLKAEKPIREVFGWIRPDTMEIKYYDFQYYYICHGEWKVKDGKFLFCEHAEDFHMDLLNESINAWVLDYSNKIAERNWPNSSRWFTFDIERLDSEWFIWSYTYPNGRKDTWEMKRVADL